MLHAAAGAHAEISLKRTDRLEEIGAWSEPRGGEDMYFEVHDTVLVMIGKNV